MKMPNIILISIDTLRADHLSCYGYYKKTTPNIDQLGSEGTIYLNNFSTGVWTPPGHTSMLTGLYVSEHGVYGSRKLAENIPTIAEVLKQNGYQTSGFVNNSQVGELVGLHKGHDLFMEVWRGISHKSKFKRVVKGSIRRMKEKLGYTDMGANLTNYLFKDWIENQVNKERPFYTFLHYIEPHNPLDPPSSFKNKYLSKNMHKDIDWNKIKKIANNPLICYVEDLKPNEGEIQFLKDLYDAEIAYTDSKIGEITSILKEKNLYENTMIIVTSDHGEHFGEHNQWSHVASLYKEVLHIPLIIKFPKGVEYANEVNKYTQLVDIFPTAMDIAGVSKENLTGNSGVSLVFDRVNGNKYHDYVFAEWEGRIPYFILEKSKNSEKDVDLDRFKVQMATIQDDQYKYIWKSNGIEEIYNITQGEKNAQNVEIEDKDKEHLMKELHKMKNEMEVFEKEPIITRDKEIEKHLKNLGYM